MLAAYSYARGWSRCCGHCAWLGLMLAGVSVLVIATIALSDPRSPGLTVFPFAAATSVCLVWSGFKLRRWEIRKRSEAAVSDKMLLPSPTERPIVPQDVLGSWWFYVDEAMSTVTIDLKPDGHYSQTIVSNRGDKVDCPGGDWKLDRAYLELTSYRSAVRTAIEGVRWFFGRQGPDLILVAKDSLQVDTMLQGRKVKTPAAL
jgi:hypothetical protein